MCRAPLFRASYTQSDTIEPRWNYEPLIVFKLSLLTSLYSLCSFSAHIRNLFCERELTVSGVAVHYTHLEIYICSTSSSRQPSRSVSLSVSFSTSVGNVHSLQLVSNVSIHIDKKKTTFSNLNEKIINKFNTLEEELRPNEVII